MGQKVHPFGFRVGITQEHQSDWFAKSGQYSIFLQEDKFIRDFIKSWFNTSGILKIKISRKVSFVYLDIFCAKPGEILNEKVFGLENLRSKEYNVGSNGQTLTTNVSMTLCNWQICHQTHVLCGRTTFVPHQIRYQINTVPTPAVAWTRA